MKKMSSFRKWALSAFAIILFAVLATGNAFAADLVPPGGVFLQVKGPAGIGVSFSVVDSKKTAIYWTKGDGVTKRNAQGFYVVKVPDLDWSKARKVCVTGVSANAIEKGSCISWSKDKKFPANGLISLPTIK